MLPRLNRALTMTMESHPVTDADRAVADRAAARTGVPPMTDTQWTFLRDAVNQRAPTAAWDTPTVYAAARVLAARNRRIGFHL